MNKRASFSQYGRRLSVVGPGVEVSSSAPGEAYFAELLISLSGGEKGTSVRNVTAFGSGHVENPLKAPIVFIGLGKKADVEGVNLQSKVALVNRGEIKFSEKVENAIGAGAVGVIIVNNQPGLLAPMVKEEGEVGVPVFMIEQEVGESINANGVTPTVTISTELGINYVIMDGTSMSSPHVAGIAALVKSVNPDLTALDVRNIITGTATSIEPALEYGKGLVNANKAVESAVTTLLPSAIAN